MEKNIYEYRSYKEASKMQHVDSIRQQVFDDYMMRSFGKALLCRAETNVLTTRASKKPKPFNGFFVQFLSL